MESFEFQVVIDCPRETVFAMYADIERWQNRNVFGEIHWVQGKPWEAESRLRIETLHPVRAVVDQVVQQFQKNERVSYISHVFGITCETHVIFVPVSAGETAVTVRMHLLGTVSRVLGFAVEPAIEKATKGFFEELRRECEAAPRSGAAGSTM